MSFSDEDLKRLTDSYETLREMRARGVSEAETMSLTLPEWDALLARLYAAERVCAHHFGRVQATVHILPVSETEGEAWEAWKKAAGK